MSKHVGNFIKIQDIFQDGEFNHRQKRNFSNPRCNSDFGINSLPREYQIILPSLIILLNYNFRKYYSKKNGWI